MNAHDQEDSSGRWICTWLGAHAISRLHNASAWARQLKLEFKGQHERSETIQISRTGLEPDCRFLLYSISAFQIYNASRKSRGSPNMTSRPLRERLQGCWRLESYTALPTAASTVQRPTYPMTKNVTGLIMYSHDGYVSAQLTIPGQKDFDGKNDEHWAEAGKRFFAYSGPFYISTEGPGGKEVLRHQFEICILPTRTGEIELRTHRFEEDDQVLVLGGVETMEIKGDVRIPVLRWRRVKDNINAQAPTPIPEIKLG